VAGNAELDSNMQFDLADFGFDFDFDFHSFELRSMNLDSYVTFFQLMELAVLADGVHLDP